MNCRVFGLFEGRMLVFRRCVKEVTTADLIDNCDHFGLKKDCFSSFSRKANIESDKHKKRSTTDQNKSQETQKLIETRNDQTNIFPPGGKTLAKHPKNKTNIHELLKLSSTCSAATLHTVNWILFWSSRETWQNVCVSTKQQQAMTSEGETSEIKLKSVCCASS